MQIVVKVVKKSLPEAVAVVTDLLRRVLPEADSKRASIEPVFPDVKAGRRAGMLTLSLHENTSSDSIGKLLHSLRASDAVEYAEPAAPKRPIGTARRS